MRRVVSHRLHEKLCRDVRCCDRIRTCILVTTKSPKGRSFRARQQQVVHMFDL